MDCSASAAIGVSPKNRAFAIGWSDSIASSNDSSALSRAVDEIVGENEACHAQLMQLQTVVKNLRAAAAQAKPGTASASNWIRK